MQRLQRCAHGLSNSDGHKSNFCSVALNTETAFSTVQLEVEQRV